MSHDSRQAAFDRLLRAMKADGPIASVDSKNAGTAEIALEVVGGGPGSASLAFAREWRRGMF